MRPYYDRDGITIFHGDCREVLAEIDPATVALAHADPPYGVAERTARMSAGRGLASGGALGRNVAGKGRPSIRDFPPIVGDDAPFDPAHLLRFPRLVTWGANHYADKLPPSASWLFWGKRDGTTPDDNGDGELAWSNLGGPPREFQHLWRGTCRASETGTTHLSPTQKPIALSAWVFTRAKLQAGDLVVVPYLGSGPDLPAAVAMGLRVIACDVEEWCCRTAVGRLGAVPHPEPVPALGPLFARAGGAP